MSDAEPLHVINNQGGEIIEIYEDFAKITFPKGFWKKLFRSPLTAGEGTNIFSLADIQISIDRVTFAHKGQEQKMDTYVLTVKNKNSESEIRLVTHISRKKDWKILENWVNEEEAKNKERHLDYDGAIQIYDKIGKPEEAARIRKYLAEENKIKLSQKIVQGDEVTKTEIKDSVLNRSNVGGKSSKAEELREAKSLFEEGLIDEDEFKQMKKEILGK
tara:strand:- start:780 stop:1430 length:651 start_codon:yes stop_codon:yes gene_type:complete